MKSTMPAIGEDAEHLNEYDDAVVARLELLWGEGFLSPDGAGDKKTIARGR